MAVDKEALICLSRVYSYYFKCNFPLFYVYPALTSDPTKFWSEIRMMSGHNNTLPSCVEGVSGKGRIVEQWRLHFENLFNCVQDLERNDMSFNAEYNDDIVYH